MRRAALCRSTQSFFPLTRLDCLLRPLFVHAELLAPSNPTVLLLLCSVHRIGGLLTPARPSPRPASPSMVIGPKPCRVKYVRRKLAPAASR